MINQQRAIINSMKPTKKQIDHWLNFKLTAVGRAGYYLGVFDTRSQLQSSGYYRVQARIRWWHPLSWVMLFFALWGSMLSRSVVATWKSMKETFSMFRWS